jgi:hypothetical protein
VTWNVKVCLTLQRPVFLGSKDIKIELNGQIEYAEVQFYFLHFSSDNLDEVPLCYALVSVYSCPVQEILVESSNTLWACRYHGDDGLQVVNLLSIMAYVSMQPLPPAPGDSSEALWFVVEKSGLEDIQLNGYEDLDSLDHEQGLSGASSGLE